MDELYPKALEYGIKPDEFWGYSLQELMDLLQVKSSSDRQNAKLKINLIFELAELIAHNVSAIFTKDVKRVYPWDVHTALFSDEQKQFAEEKEKEAIRKVADSRKRYAAQWNQRKSKELN